MVLVMGATGRCGSWVTKRLMEHGARVRAFVRARDRGGQFGGIEVSVGDFDDRASVQAALHGVEKMFLATPGGPTQIERQCAIIDTARAAGVRHIVKLSGLGASPSAPITVAKQHGLIERHLAASGLEYTVLRPNFFMQNFLGLAVALRGGVLPVPAAQGRVSFIDARDVAEIAARLLAARRPPTSSHDLTGSEALNHDDVAAAFGRQLGRSIQYVDITIDAFKDGARAAGMDEWHAHAFAELYEHVVRPGHMGILAPPPLELLGRAPTRFGEFAAEHIGTLQS
jgi:uncharacterized protein YbjT (DUF2867 family)